MLEVPLSSLVFQLFDDPSGSLVEDIYMNIVRSRVLTFVAANTYSRLSYVCHFISRSLTSKDL